MIKLTIICLTDQTSKLTNMEKISKTDHRKTSGGLQPKTKIFFLTVPDSYLNFKGSDIHTTLKTNKKKNDWVQAMTKIIANRTNMQ